MNTKVRNLDESRLPPRDDDGRVSARDCAIVEATLMLPAGTSVDEVRELMERLYAREPSVLHWSTNWIDRWAHAS